MTKKVDIIRKVNIKNQITLTDECMKAIGIEKESFVRIEYDVKRKHVVLMPVTIEFKK